MSKIKVFLGGVVNVPNAQNINCLSLSKFLDSERFEVITLQSSRAKIVEDICAEFVVIKEPVKLFKYFAFLWGIIKADICYFPKTECMSWNFFWCKVFGKKYFRTIETVFDERLLSTLKTGKKEYVIEDYKNTENLYAITKHMKDFNLKSQSIICKSKILYLGIDDDSQGKTAVKAIGSLKNVIIVGHDLMRKGIEEYLELADIHPDITFHIVGSGNNKIDLANCNKDNNIAYHGPLNRTELNSVLENIDLLVLPSHSEGFPKVILESAAKGIPSLVYASYGANEWMTDNQNGFVAVSKTDFFNKLALIKNDTELLRNVQPNLSELFAKFTWSSRIGEWEEVIESIYEQS